MMYSNEFSKCINMGSKFANSYKNLDILEQMFDLLRAFVGPWRQKGFPPSEGVVHFSGLSKFRSDRVVFQSFV